MIFQWHLMFALVYSMSLQTGKEYSTKEHWITPLWPSLSRWPQPSISWGRLLEGTRTNQTLGLYFGLTVLFPSIISLMGISPHLCFRAACSPTLIHGRLLTNTRSLTPPPSEPPPLYFLELPRINRVHMLWREWFSVIWSCNSWWSTEYVLQKQLSKCPEMFLLKTKAWLWLY